MPGRRVTPSVNGTPPFAKTNNNSKQKDIE